MTVCAGGSHIGSHVETAFQRVTVITGKLHCAQGPCSGATLSKTIRISLRFFCVTLLLLLKSDEFCDVLLLVHDLDSNKADEKWLWLKIQFPAALEEKGETRGAPWHADHE